MAFYCLGKHTYDPESGWCVRCGCARADGRATTPGGRVLMPGTTNERNETVIDLTQYELEVPE